EPKANSGLAAAHTSSGTASLALSNAIVSDSGAFCSALLSLAKALSPGRRTMPPKPATGPLLVGVGDRTKGPWVSSTAVANIRPFGVTEPTSSIAVANGDAFDLMCNAIVTRLPPAELPIGVMLAKLM